MSKKRIGTWPLAIIISLVVFASFMTYIAIYLSNSKYNLVTDTYYEETVTYQDRINQKQAAHALGEQPRWLYAADKQELRLHFPESYAHKVLKGTVTFYRPDNPSADFSKELTLDQNGEFLFSCAGMKFGKWRAMLEWEHEAASFYVEEVLIL